MGTSLPKSFQSCGEEKRLNEYHENQTKADKRNGICKQCQAEVDKANRNGAN